MITRRGAIWGGASAILLAGCGQRPARTLAGDPHDLRILAAALEAERAQIALYEIGKAIGGVRLVDTILGHERAHAAAIEESIRELGGTPAAARAASQYARGVPRSGAAWRRHAINAEQQWAAGYQAVIPKLANERLRATFGALMTTEAEHAVALGVTR